MHPTYCTSRQCMTSGHLCKLSTLYTTDSLTLDRHACTHARVMIVVLCVCLSVTELTATYIPRLYIKNKVLLSPFQDMHIIVLATFSYRLPSLLDSC